jgi:hypothetical protein
MLTLGMGCQADSLQARKSMAEPTYEELKAKLSQLEKEVEVKKRSGEMTFKVGEACTDSAASRSRSITSNGTACSEPPTT